MREKMIRRYGQQYLDYRSRWATAERMEALDFPVNLELDLIDACTLSCPQCLRSPDLLPAWQDYIGRGSRLEHELIARMLDEAAQYNLPSVNIGGSGECMLHPDFLKICRTVMEHDVIELRIISNGTRLSRDIARGLIEQQVHFLSISIDAVCTETYRKVRGKAEMYEKVVDNVNGFLEERARAGSVFPMLRVTFVRQDSNREDATAFVDYWSSKADLVDIQTYCDYRQQADFKSNFICNQPWKRLAIYADGHAAPCCGFPGIKFDLGSVYEKSLKSIWDGMPLKQIRRALREKPFPEPCLQCMGSLQA